VAPAVAAVAAVAVVPDEQGAVGPAVMGLVAAVAVVPDVPGAVEALVAARVAYAAGPASARPSRAGASRIRAAARNEHAAT
jgi:hypothetical protein